MSLIEQTLENFFLGYPDQPVVIAYSGGVDSQVLLHALARLTRAKRLDNPLTVCHINHGLSENAALWQQSAELECQKLGLELICRQVTLELASSQSLEALAREARYQALQQLAPKGALIITGHHSDDQGETLLLALKRGAGLKGLSAMACVSALAEHTLVRPLLAIRRQEIEAYARQHHLDWIEDESNSDTRFDRNFIRHQIMPLLSGRWPSIVATMARSSEHCREGQQLLTELAQEDLARAILSARSLSVSELKKLSRARFNNLLRYFLEQHKCLMPSAEQLNQVYVQLGAPADKTPAVKMAQVWLRRYRDGLYLTGDFKDIGSWQYRVELAPGGEVITIELPDHLGGLSFASSPDKVLAVHGLNPAKQESVQESKQERKTLYLRPPQASEPVTVKFSHQNPKCLPDYRQHSRPLKKVLQELALPPWVRLRIPFIYYGETLVAAAGYFVCKDYLAENPGENNRAYIKVNWREQ
ncbi:tRNA lysidine(34) synthetase TilS [Thalassomonas haliotis]|uniref:tRNA(Ile)-lysidine synthase n=1 Tax=Thalassomonas haliotis TaxID=485448 RepID=A0ABY7VA08_9GAMM|nr:tRNA lysidine(34) synthetase TilS [Thalassomonas haliotis]WDE10423.1 tRNA lysidine(34) synthetase TilS [Thalassomonas haliotis]